jgi:hypothetical protein
MKIPKDIVILESTENRKRIMSFLGLRESILIKRMSQLARGVVLFLILPIPVLVGQLLLLLKLLFKHTGYLNGDH